MQDKLLPIVMKCKRERLTAVEETQAIIAALPKMVVPLEWLEGGSDSIMHDADFVDTTQTYQIQEGLFWYAAEVQGVPCGSNDAAKAAAQADYTRRILSAFGINPNTGEQTDV